MTEASAGTTDRSPSEIVLGPMLRFVDQASATIFVETSGPARIRCLDSETTTFCVRGRHFALSMIEGLEPGTTTPYEIELDGTIVWPLDQFPPSVIRTKKPSDPVRVLMGSCRAAAPHEPPYDRELAFDPEGRGVDTLWAHATRMLEADAERWPDLLLFLGDQIYADDSSPRTKERIETLRADELDLPAEIVADFEEYCWLYHEAWSPPTERWLFSTVSSAMIFDDHDNIDDWNISAAWVSDTRAEPWWEDHSIGGLMSYWIYQHLGNLSPDQIRSEGLLEELVAADDGTEILERWARQVERDTPNEGGYRFSFSRCIGDVTLIVVDCRNSRVLDAQTRLMVGPNEWEMIRGLALEARGHLLIGTSVPVFIPDGLHDLQVWNESVCDGAWGRRFAKLGEKIRRGLDLEDWSAFGNSYRDFVSLLDDVRRAEQPPASIVIASGDIHFSYASTVPGPAFGDPSATAAAGPPVWQVVSSPIRNALIPPERSVMRLTLRPIGRRLGALLRRSVRAADTRPHIDMTAGPYFANNMCELTYDSNSVHLRFEQATSSDDGELLTEVDALDLVGVERRSSHLDLPTDGGTQR